ncbi:MAG: leucocin A/sakacin P family class II bacteriocin [Liquorilactobacillus ghanensis]|uniref:leucocin A/sakacin P family class II bacteriocin n=1 Tax=Liquorilactobacillus ghanensis TaxID=399370 RepID=UPI0039EC31FD
MKKEIALSEKELLKITGGKYYGNGVSCTKKHGCKVNWGQAFTCSVNRFANYGHGNC